MKVRRGAVVVLVTAMAAVGVGCSPTPPLTQNEQVGIGNFIFFTIYVALCQANNGVCPFPLGPTALPPTPPAAN
jgi:hypothetical protein